MTDPQSGRKKVPLLFTLALLLSMLQPGWSDTIANANPAAFSVPNIDNIFIQSPNNSTTYNTTDIPLNFKINSESSYPNILYMIDGNQSQTIHGNTTLTKLSNGEHSVVVYAVSREGNALSAKVSFMIQASESYPNQTLIIAIAASIAILALVAGACYFKIVKAREKRV